MALVFKLSLGFRGEEGGGEEGVLPRCWVNVEPRAPGGYLSPRGSECSPVGIPPTSSLLPPLLGEAEGIWIGGPTWTLWGPFLQKTLAK